MKNVLLVSMDGLGSGGIQNVIMNIVRNNSDNYNFDIIVFHTGEGYDDYKMEFENYGNIYLIDRNHCDSKIKMLFKYVRRPLYEYLSYKKIMKNNKYDIVHCHNEEESTLALKAAKKCNIRKRISHSHNANNRNMRKDLLGYYWRFLRKRISKYATDCVGCSKMALDSLFEKKNNPLVVYNPIDTEQFNYINSCKLNIKNQNESLNLICVARYCDQKNQIYLLPIIKYIKNKGFNVKLTLIGYGEDEENLHKKTKKLDLDENVFFLPPNSNVKNLLSKNDIFVFPSIHEGLGIALLEAQFIGLKCFASTNVPLESNLGFVEYLELDDNPKFWGDTIISYFEKYKHKRWSINEEKRKEFSLEVFNKKIRLLYQENGEN